MADLSGVLVEVGEDAQPAEDGPHPVFLPDVVGTCTEALLATDKRREVLESRRIERRRKVNITIAEAALGAGATYQEPLISPIVTWLGLTTSRSI